jgi:RNA polymerase sigma-70 factor (ECF subfamily)
VEDVTPAQFAVTEAFRSEWGDVVAHVIRLTGNWDLAEECAQDALTKALEKWAHNGVPTNPAAWLKTTARNQAYDRLRCERVGQVKLQQVALNMRTSERDEADGNEIADDRLRLLFTCCHPALPAEAQVALALRTLLGLTTAEIARAFLVPEETMAKRLVRAKHKIRDAAIPYRVPPAPQLPDRLVGVLAAIYGLFNQGYGASSGSELIRTVLCDEAIRLGRLLTQLMPDESEAMGLLSLMILHNARRRSRVDQAGELVTLGDQDRSLWDTQAIDEGGALLERAIRLNRSGPYQVLAAIAACHATAPTAADTDWIEVARLYEQLYGMTPSPVVALNRAVAVAMVDGPAAGLALVDALDVDATISDYYLLPATRADLLRRLGRTEDAEVAYRRAVEIAPSEPERAFIRRRIVEMQTSVAQRMTPLSP